jgi:glyoxylate reductase
MALVVTNRIPAPASPLRAEHEVRAWERRGVHLARRDVLRLVAGADAVVTLLTELVDDEFLDAAGPAAAGRRQRRGRLQQHRRAGLQRPWGDRDEHAAACSPSHRGHAFGLMLMVTRRLGEGERIIRSRTRGSGACS